MGRRRLCLPAILGANTGATRANDFPRQPNESGHAAADHASSRTDPDEAERDTGIYGSAGRGLERADRVVDGTQWLLQRQRDDRGPAPHPHGVQPHMRGQALLNADRLSSLRGPVGGVGGSPMHGIGSIAATTRRWQRRTLRCSRSPWRSTEGPAKPLSSSRAAARAR